MLRSGLPLPESLGRGFTCHPALILVAEHARPITNDVGHPKSFFVDRAEAEGFVLETCMYFPFTTAKALTGFGAAHSAMMRAYPRQQQILVLAVDHAAPENHVTVDRDGNPVVHYRFSRAALEGLVRGNRAAARIFFAGGAVRVHAPFADPPVIEAAEADRLETRIHAPALEARQAIDYRRAPDGRVRHGKQRGGLRDRRLGTGARSPLAARRRRVALSRMPSRSTRTSPSWRWPIGWLRPSGKTPDRC